MCPLVLSIKTKSGSLAPVNGDLSLTFKGFADGEMFSDSNCTTSQTAELTIAKGFSSKVLYIKPLTAKDYLVEVSDPSKSVDDLTHIITVVSPASEEGGEELKLALSGPTNAPTNQCKAYLLTLQNAAGASRTKATPESITLAGGGSGSFYNGTNCSGAAVTTLDLLANNSFVSFSYKSTVAENLIFIADAPGSASSAEPIQAGVLSVQITAPIIILPSQLVLSGAGNITAGACAGPIVVRAVDSSANSVAVPADVPLTLSGGPGFSVFTDASCVTPLVAPKVAAGASTMSYYYIASTPGNLTLVADDNGSLTDGALNVVASVSLGGTAVKLSLNGPSSVLVGQCSAAYVIKTLDGSNIEYPVNASTPVSITGKGAGDFYADATCLTPVSSVTFASGESSKAFYYKAVDVASLNFNVDDAGSLTPGSTMVAVQPGAPVKLAVTGPSPLTVSECRAYAVTAKDVNNFSASVSALTAINLTGAGSGAFYTDSSCSTQTTSTTINSGHSSAVFYYKPMAAGSPTLSADNSGGLTAGTLAITVNPLSPTKVLMSRASLTANTCSPISVTLKDALDGAAITPSPVTVNLTASGSSNFYSNVGCSTLITSATVPSSASSVTVYLKDSVSESLSLTAASTGLISDNWNVSVNPAPPSKLSLLGLGSAAVGDCLAYDLRVEDANGNLSNVTSNTTINFIGLGNGKLYSDASCSVIVSSVVIGTGSSQKSIYLRNSIAESVTVLASGGGLTNASKAIVFNPAGANKLVLTGAATSVAAACSTFTLSVQDSFGNPVPQASNLFVIMMGEGNGSFYSDSNCTTPSAIVTIASAASSQSFYFKSLIPETLSFIGQAADLIDASKTLQVIPGAPSKLSLLGLGSAIVGECLAYDLRVEDVNNNLSNVTSNTTINFTGLGSAKVYSDAGCSSVATSVIVGTGSAQKSVYLRNSVAEALTVGATGGGLTAASKAITINPAGANKLILSGVSSSLAAACNTLTVSVQDSFGNPVPQGSNLTVTLMGEGNGSYFSDSGCTAAVSTVTVATSASSKTFYFKSSVPENLNFVAQSSGLVDASKAFQVAPQPASKLLLSGSGTIQDIACSPYTVTVLDALNNLSPVGSSKTLNFTGAGTGSFFADAACLTASSSVVLSSNQTNATVYYKASSAQSLNFTVDDVGMPDLASSTLPVTVNSANSGPTMALKISGSASINVNTCVPYALLITNSSGNSVNAESDITVNLAGAGTGAFYSDNACGTPAAAVTITTGTSIAYAYYKAAATQNLVFSGTSTAASSATLPVTVIVAANNVGPTKLSISGNTSVYTASCVPFIVSSLDSNGNSVNVSSLVTVNLSGVGSGSFYSDAACSSTITSTSIASSTSYQSIYYKNASAQNLIFVAQATDFSNATLSITVNAPGADNSSGPPVKLAFVGQPSAIATVNVDFSSQPIITVQDSNNNVSGSSNATVTLAAFIDASCTTPASGTLGATVNPLVATNGVANFAGVDLSNAQTIYLGASSPGLASACSTAVQVYPSVPTKLAFTQQPSSTATVGVAFTAQPQVSVLNHTGQVMTTSTNTVSIAAYADATCSTPASGTLTVNSNNLLPTNGVVAFAGAKFSSATTVYLKATASGLTSACSAGILVSSGAAYSLGFLSDPPSTVTSAESFAVQISVRDQYGNITPVTDNIKLTGYSTSDCSGAELVGFSGGTSTAAANGAVSFPSVAVTGTGTITIKAEDLTNGAVLTACSNQITVKAGAPAALSFLTQPSSIGFAGAELTTAPVVRILDASGNLATTGTLPVTLQPFTDSNCTAAAPGTLTVGSNPLNSSMGRAYFSFISYSVSGNIYLKASSPGLASACSTVINIGASISAVAAGDQHTCAISRSNVYCWGRNDYGQLGNGTISASANTPVQVVDVTGTGALSDIIHVAAGYRYTCAVKSDGSVYCWGYNGYGNLGDNTTTNRLLPTQVKGVANTGFLTGISKISIGGTQQGVAHTCALSTGGSVYCWGYNGYGQLGSNNTTNYSVPVQVLGVGAAGTLSNIRGISAGGYHGHTCAVNTSNAVFCWGHNASGQLGDNTATNRSVPVQVVGVNGSGLLGSIANVSTGSYHTCANSSGGDVYCWGNNTNGQLGINSTTQYSHPRQVFSTSGAGTLTGITSVVAGGYSTTNGSTCAVSGAGALYCWGFNNSGQLGDNSVTQRTYPVQVVGVGGTGMLTDVQSVVLGGGPSYAHTCAVHTNGEISCFGSNQVGNLGNGASYVTAQQTPVKVLQLNAVVFTNVASSNDHACAVSGGKVYCWGYNNVGQLGDGTTTARTTPVPVLGVGGTGLLSDIVSLSIGGNHSYSDSYTCALSSTGVVYCWGGNNNGQLGDGSTTNRSSPVVVQGLPTASQVAAGSFSGGVHTCAVTTLGYAYCWGANGYNQLGDGSGTQRSFPVQVKGVNGTGVMTGVTAITSGGSNYGHTCLIANEAAYCWGSNDGYQVGDGTATNRAYPTAVSGLTSGVTAISAGNSWSTYNGFTCAIKSGAAYCWGTSAASNSQGNLGTSPTLRWSSGVTSIAAGRDWVCAVVDGEVRCYAPYSGSNITVGPNLKNVVQISNSSTYTSNGQETVCAIDSSGALYCWGYNGYNALGNGSGTASSTPWKVSAPAAGALSVSSVATGTAHSCAVANGFVKCWGAGTNGALGNGSSAQVTTTSDVLLNGFSLSPASVVTNGGTHSCSYSPLGSVYCWGDNLFGDLGNNSTIQSSKAVQVRGPNGVGNLAQVTSLASGFHHNCAVSNGAVYCWGWNGSGQIGNNSNVAAAVPAQVLGVGGTGTLSGFTKVAAGYAHSCGLKNDGTVYCWGNNQYGQIGDTTFSQANTPVQVVGPSGTGALSNVTAIAAGGYHTCAISNQQAYCWGANSSGQLGNASTVPAAVPQPVFNSGLVGLSGVTSIAGGANFSCAVTNIGGVMCWGAGGNGQLGNGGTANQDVASDVVGVGGAGLLSAIRSVSSGSTSYHACATTVSGSAVYCWGAGGNGQMGTGSTTAGQLTPVQSTVAGAGLLNFVIK